MTDAGLRMSALARHNAMLILREPGPVISRLVQPGVSARTVTLTASAATSIINETYVINIWF